MVEPFPRKMYNFTITGALKDNAVGYVQSQLHILCNALNATGNDISWEMLIIDEDKDDIQDKLD